MGAQAVRLSNVDIDNALKNKDFEVLFQPIFDLRTGALTRMETFVRWRHPNLGALPPGAFISFFESQGRMSELTRYVLAEALDAYEAWRGPYAPGFSINLALTDLTDEGFTPHFVKKLRDRNFPAELVTLECPMPPVDMPLDLASSSFAELRKTGARLAIEVRGRANELLKNIDPFPFDEIKTGGASILRFARTVRGPGMSAISDLLDIAARAESAIVAVGVEDQASLSALRGLGFTAAQGNHLATVGSIADFRLNRVNEVRELLDLEPFSQDELATAFRSTNAAVETPSGDKMLDVEVIEEPADKTGVDRKTAVSPKNKSSCDELDDIVDRLNKRVESHASESDAPSAQKQASDKKSLTARKRAKAAVLAKRAKLRKARKEAAIAQAKARAEAASPLLEPSKNNENKQTDSTARELQSRIEREYISDETEIDASGAQTPATDTPVETIVESTTAVAADGNAPVTTEKVENVISASEGAHDITPDPVRAPATSQSVPPPQSIEDRSQDPATPFIQDVEARFTPTYNVQAPPITSHAAPAPAAQPAVAAPKPKIDYHDPSLQTGSLFEALDESENPATLPDAVTADTPLDDDIPSMFRRGINETQPDDAHSEEPMEVTLPTPKPKNFLTRKYKVVPTHFWPKSWKRKFAKTRRQPAE